MDQILPAVGNLKFGHKFPVVSGKLHGLSQVSGVGNQSLLFSGEGLLFLGFCWIKSLISCFNSAKKPSLFLDIANAISWGSVCINWSAENEHLSTTVRILIVIGYSVTFRAETYNALLFPTVLLRS